MDQARLWNPFIKLLVKHKISNLILFLISFSYRWSDGERNQGLRRGEREAVDRTVVSEDCYSEDKRSHQSKLKKGPLGLEWDSIRAGTCMPACTPVKMSACCGPDSQGQSWADGWGRIQLSFSSCCSFKSAALSHICIYHREITQHLHKLIKRLSMWSCLTARTINNSNQCSDCKMCLQSSTLHN